MVRTLKMPKTINQNGIFIISCIAVAILIIKVFADTPTEVDFYADIQSEGLGICSVYLTYMGEVRYVEAGIPSIRHGSCGSLGSASACTEIPYPENDGSNRHTHRYVTQCGSDPITMEVRFTDLDTNHEFSKILKLRP